MKKKKKRKEKPPKRVLQLAIKRCKKGDMGCVCITIIDDGRLYAFTHSHLHHPAPNFIFVSKQTNPFGFQE